MNKQNLHPLSKIYIFIIASSIFPILFITTPSIRLWRLPELLFWIILEIIADIKPVYTLKLNEKMQITMSFAVQLSAAILLGTGEAAWVIIIATLIVEIITRKPLDKVLFNAGQYGLALLAGSYLFHILKMSPDAVALDVILDMPAILVSVSVYFLLNALFVSTVISLTTGNRFMDIFLSDFKITITYFYTLVPVSIGMALLYSGNPHQPFLVLLFLPPILITDQALRRYFNLHRDTHETLRVLAKAIDERDEYTAAHSSRVAEYAMKIARHMDLPLDVINEVEMAGTVHDLGKIGIEDKILRKNGKLNDDEYSIIKKHSEIGYHLLKNLKLYENGAEYVLYHHEHMDGTGYPLNMSGSDIPLGARILTVADSYDAMTSDRVYRKALPQDIAVKELLRCSGTQFDPIIVKAFIEVLKADYGYVEVETECLLSTQ